MTDLAKLGLYVDSTGVVRATGDLSKFGKEGQRADGIAAKFGATGKAAFGAVAVAAAGAVSAIASIGGAVSVIRQFETSMSQVSAITGATRGQLESLRDVAKELGSTTEFSAAQAADGLKFLGMAGFSAAESIEAIPAVLDLATASSMGLAESADIASNVLSGFGLAASEAGQVADVLAAASSRANTNVSQLGTAMSTVAPISAALGIDLADTAAAIGVLSDAGIQGERAGTALRGVLASLAGPTDAATEALAQYGITAAQVNPETQSLTQIFGLLAERGLSTADAMTIFGREAASGALVLAEASGRVGEFGEELRGAEGAASDMAGIMRDNLAGSANSALSALQGLAIALGEAGLTAVLRAGLDAVTAMARGLTRLVEIGGDFIGWITSFGTFEGALSRVQAASDTANLAIADTLAQVNALSVAEMGGRQVSLDYAGAKLEQARASYAAAEAIKQENIAQVQASEEYQSLIEKQNRLNETISMLQDILSESPSQAALDMIEFMRDPTDPDNLDGFVVQLERSLEKLRETVAQQQMMTDAVGGTNEKMEAALREIELYEAAIAAAKDGTVTLGAETSNAADTTAALARLAGAVNFDSAASSAQSLADWLGISLSRAMALAATTPAMADEDLLMSQGVIPDAEARAAQREAVENFNRMSAAMNRVGGSARSAGRASSEAREEIEDFADEIERLEDAADPLRKFRRELEQLDTLLENGLSDGAYAHAVRELNDELVESTPILSSVNDAFGQMVDYMFDGFKDGMKGILNIFVNTLKQMAATALKNRITIGLGMAATGGAGAAAAGVPSGGGILSNLGGLWGTAESAGLFGGTGLLGMGGGSGLLGLGPGSGLATMLGGGTFGTVASYAIPVLGVGLALAGLFKKTEVLVAEGVRARIDGASLELDSYEKTKTNNGFGMSSGFDRDFERLDDAVQSAVQVRLDAAVDALEAFGFGTDLTGFSFSKRTEIKEGETFEGESEEVIREALDAVVDYLAEGALDVFMQAGETVSQTLERLSTSLAATNQSLDFFGGTLLPISLDGAAAAAALTDLYGGLENFAASAQFLFENFYTDAEKLEIATGQLNTAFEQLGVSVPATHAAYRDLINAQDLMTEEGRNLHAGLTQLAPLFTQVNGTAQEAADAAANDLVPALDDASDGMTNAADAARDLAAIEREREGLLMQIARMTGNVAYVREQELAALDPSNRALQQHIYMLEDEAQARRDAADAARAALGAANNLVSTMEGNLADANRDLDQAYSDLESAVNNRIQTLEQERDGYVAAAEAAREALVALGAIAATRTPLQQAQDAQSAYEQGLSDLSTAIDRERSALQGSIGEWQSELSEIASRTYVESAELQAAQAAYSDTLGQLASAVSRERSDLEAGLSAWQAELDEISNRVYVESEALREAGAAYDETLRGLSAAISRERSILEGNISEWESELSEIANRVRAESQALREAEADYNAALSGLSAGIDRERSELQSRVSGWESEAERLRNALFPGEDEDIIAALTARDVMSDTLNIAERLANAARDVLRLNSEIVERQRVSALAQLRAMLTAGRVDAGSLDRVISDATSFSTAQFGSFEEMALEQKKTAGVLLSLSELQEDQAVEAQAAEDERAEAARQTALSQLSALEAQIAQGNQQIGALDALADSFGLLEVELASGELAKLAREQKAAFDAARAADDAAWTAQQRSDAERAGQLETMISGARAQAEALNALSNDLGLIEAELSSGELSRLAREQKRALDEARAADDAAWATQQAADSERERQLSEQIDAAKSQLFALGQLESEIGLNTNELSSGSLASLAREQKAILDAAQASDAAAWARQQASDAERQRQLNAQISAAQTQIQELGQIAAAAGLTATERSARDLFAEMQRLKSASQAAHSAAVQYYRSEMSANSAAASAASDQIRELRSQYSAILTVNTSVRSVEQAVLRLAGAQDAFASATQDMVEAQRAQAQALADMEAAQRAANSTPTTPSLSDAERALLAFLSGTPGAAGAGMLGTDAFARMSEDGTNAILSATGVSALTGMARSVANAYADILNRNVDVLGLEYYIDAIGRGGIDIAGVIAQLAASTEAITGVTPGFSMAGVPSYAAGTDYHPGGLARLHQNELVNLPRGTSVSTAGEVRDMVNELRALRQRNEEMAVELRQIRRFAQSRTDILEDQRAEQLAAEATA